MSSYALVAILAERVNKSLDNYVQHSQMSQEDIEWVGAYMRDMLREMRNELYELEELTTDDELEMKDDERKESIQMLEQDIRGSYEMGMTFLEQINELLILSRQQKVNEEYLKKLL
jgi:polyhydroxyalkanoate synthesis regulator phasin